MATITIVAPRKEMIRYIEMQILPQLKEGYRGGHWDYETHWDSEGLQR